jgi:nucleoredoxin
VRNIILIVLALALTAGLYASVMSFASVSDLAMTAKDLLFPAAKEEAPKPAPAPQKVVLSGFPAKFQNSLMILDDGTPRAVDTSTLMGVKYWAFYYSASWCPPCRAFTPDLVSFYRDFKPAHPDFELIFVNDDNNEEDMLNYMKGDSMPWPAVWYSDIDNPELEAKKYCGDGIPCLVLVDADGQVLSDTYQGGQYTDPHHVIDDIRATVR